MYSRALASGLLLSKMTALASNVALTASREQRWLLGFLDTLVLVHASTVVQNECIG